MHVRSPYPQQVSDLQPAGGRDAGTAHHPRPRRLGGVCARLLRFAWPPPPWQSLAAAAGVLTLLGGLGLLVGAHRGSVMPAPVVALEAALALGFLPAGLYVVSRRARQLAPMLVAMTGLLALLGLASAAWSGVLVGAWLAHWTWWPAVGLLPVLVWCYPTAPTTPRASAWVDIAAFAAAAGTGCLMDAAAVSPNADLIEESRRIGIAATILTVGWLVAAVVTAGTLVGALIRLQVRGVQGRQRTRRWALCLLPAAALVPVAAVLTWQGVPFAYLLPVPVLGVGLAAGLLPDDGGHGDRWWQRGLSATLCVSFAYLLVSAGFAWLPRLATAYPWLVPVIGAALVVGIVAATARWWWRGVGALTSRLRYGREAASYAALRDVPEPVASVRNAMEIAEAVTSALGVHGTRIRADLDGELVTVAEYGRCVEPRTSLPVTDGERRLGTLEVTPREPERIFDEHELATLRRATRRVASALAAEQVVWAANRVRVAATTRREEDRRWLRTELHDTFLPALSGCRGQLEAARLRMPSNRTAALLDPIIEELTDMSAAVRSLMGDLRPDLLEHGLRTAIEQVARRRLPDVEVAIEVPSDGAGAGPLPCAVEVAAYRIAVEALTCAALRGGVRGATVRLTRTPRQVDLLVLDDGAAALSASSGDGGDTAAMRRLAEDVGGRLSVITSPAGTRVCASLPLPVSEDAPEPAVVPAAEADDPAQQAEQAEQAEAIDAAEAAGAAEPSVVTAGR